MDGSFRDESPIVSVREQRFDGGWADYTPPEPRQPGLHVLDDYPLADLVEVIDWTPFFQAWELAGKYPAILADPVVGAQASALLGPGMPRVDPRVLST